MPLADYAHWNEEAEQVWWQEEGRHGDEPLDPDYDRDRSDELDALDAFGEEVAEWSADEILDRLADPEWCARWPRCVPILRDELEYRGVKD